MRGDSYEANLFKPSFSGVVLPGFRGGLCREISREAVRQARDAQDLRVVWNLVGRVCRTVGCGLSVRERERGPSLSLGGQGVQEERKGKKETKKVFQLNGLV